jgi:hypothetical protein
MAVEVELSLVAVRQIAAEEQQQLRDLSPWASCTDQATAACQRS